MATHAHEEEALEDGGGHWPGRWGAGQVARVGEAGQGLPRTPEWMAGTTGMTEKAENEQNLTRESRARRAWGSIQPVLSRWSLGQEGKKQTNVKGLVTGKGPWRPARGPDAEPGREGGAPVTHRRPGVPGFSREADLSR